MLVNCTSEFPDPAASAGFQIFRCAANRWSLNAASASNLVQALAPAASAAASAAVLVWCEHGTKRSALVAAALLLAATRASVAEVAEHLLALCR